MLEKIKLRHEKTKILIISDQPKRPSFHQIENLREVLQIQLEQKIDLLVFSQKSLLFNEQIRKANDVAQILKEVESIIDRGLYSFYVISLEKSNIAKLFFSKEENILKMISKYPEKSTILIFVAQSVLNHIKEIYEHQKLDMYLFPRKGVSKISKEFKQQILNLL